MIVGLNYEVECQQKAEVKCPYLIPLSDRVPIYHNYVLSIM